MTPLELTVNMLPWILVFAFGMLVYVEWRRERRADRWERQRQLEEERMREDKRREDDVERERFEKYLKESRETEEKVKIQAGDGTGGYIVLDLPDGQRPLFHDLLKGFEEFAQLKGYRVAFSVDNTFQDRIAFKFTLTDPDIVVSNERVRKDLKEYLDKVAAGDLLDDLPQIVSLQEHEILVATLKNRISFLQHSYNLAKNSAEFYERIMRQFGTQPLLPAQNIVLNTGGAYHAPTYTALNSPQAVLGVDNTSASSIHIATTHRDRVEQIQKISVVLEKLTREEPLRERDEAIRNLENIKEELEVAEQPDVSRVSRWLERAKQAMQVGSLGHETLEAAKELFQAFNPSS